jgi:hypothetical protein
MGQSGRKKCFQKEQIIKQKHIEQQRWKEKNTKTMISVFFVIVLHRSDCILLLESFWTSEVLKIFQREERAIKENGGGDEFKYDILDIL